MPCQFGLVCCAMFHSWLVTAYFLPFDAKHGKMWFVAFVLTQIVEAPLYLWRLQTLPHPWLQRFAIALGASTLTHPFVWFAVPWYAPWPPMLIFLGAETFAVVVEGYYLQRWGCPRPWLWSLLINTVSASIGQLLHFLYPSWIRILEGVHLLP